MKISLFRKHIGKVLSYLRFLKRAFSDSVAVYAVTICGTFIFASTAFPDLFKYSTDYFLFLVLYPVSLYAVISDHVYYFVKK